TSQPFTSSSGSTSRSWNGHHRFCLIGVPHSRCSVRNATSVRWVANARPIGMLTSPKLIDPFQIVRMGLSSILEGPSVFALPHAFPSLYDGSVTTASPTAPAAELPLEARTAPALWRYALAQGWTTPAYLEEQPDGWREGSWQAAGERVEALAQALLAQGARKGDAVAVLSRTRLEWILLDWAIMSIGAVVVGLYPTNTATECAYILGHSEAVLAFTEDEVQREKLASVGSQLPQL